MEFIATTANIDLLLNVAAFQSLVGSGVYCDNNQRINRRVRGPRQGVSIPSREWSLLRLATPGLMCQPPARRVSIPSREWSLLRLFES